MSEQPITALVEELVLHDALPTHSRDKKLSPEMQKIAIAMTKSVKRARRSEGSFEWQIIAENAGNIYSLGVSALSVGSLVAPILDAPIGVGIGLTTIWGIETATSSFYKKARARTCKGLPNGYTLQTFRTNIPYSGHKPCEAAILVTPRRYEDGQKELPFQTVERLQQAALIIAQALPDKVIVPTEILTNVSAILPATPLRRTLEAITGYEVCDTVAVKSPALSMDLASFLEMVEQAETKDNGAARRAILRELYARFPYINEFAGPPTLAEATLRAHLPALTARAAEAFATSAIRQKVDNAEVGSIITKTPLPHLEVKVLENYDLQVVQPDSFRGIYEQLPPLRQMGELLFRDPGVLTKLTAGRSEVSDLDLLAIAAYIFEQPDVPEEKAMQDNGDVGWRIDAILPKGEARRYLQQRIGRLMLVGAFAALIPAGIHYLQERLVLPDRSSETSSSSDRSGIGAVPETDKPPKPLWHIESYGNPTAGYYTENLYYYLNFQIKAWRGELSKKTIILPSSVPNPYHSLSTFVDGRSYYDLSVKVGTTVGAVRVKNAKGEAVPVEVYRSEEGVMRAMVYEQERGMMLTYDLVESDARVKAKGTLEADVEINKSTIAALPEVATDLSTAVDYVKNQFAYNNSSSLDAISQQDTPKDFLETAYKKEICNCNVCATQIGMIAIAKTADQGDITAAFTSGYLGSNDSQFLHTGQRHAWITSGHGSIIDATPAGTEQEEITDAKLLEEEWQKSRNYYAPADLPLWPVIPAIAGLLIAGEVRYRPLRRAARRLSFAAATWTLPEDEAKRYLAWHAYGKDSSPPPAFLEQKMGQRLSVTSIPGREILQDIAKNGLRSGSNLTPQQYRALQRIVKTMVPKD